MTDLSLLQDFITETNEHLEEMEANLLLLETAPDNRELLNEIFRSTHTIKGSSEYMGMEKIAELSHHLENLLENLRHGTQSPDPQMIDLLIDSKDRMSALIRDIEHTQSENTETDDLLVRIDDLSLGKQAVPEEEAEPPEPDLFPGAGEEPPPVAESGLPPEQEGAIEMEEEYDEELFEIFIQHLQENLEKIISCIEGSENGIISAEVIDNCLGIIDGLHSSANYMDYDKVTRLYDIWQEQIESGKDSFFVSDTGVLKGPDGESLGFFSGMTAYVRRLVTYFPQIKLTLPPDDRGVPGGLPSGEEPGLPDEPPPVSDEFLLEESPDDFSAGPAAPPDAPDYSAGILSGDEPVFSGETPPLTNDPPFEEKWDEPAYETDYNGFYNELDSLFSGDTGPMPPAQELSGAPLPEPESPDPVSPEPVFSGEPLIEAETGTKENARNERADSSFRGTSGTSGAPGEAAPVAGPSMPPVENVPEEAVPEPPDAVLPVKESENEPAAEPAAPSAIERSVKQSIRVDARKIDSLMNQVGELVVSRAWFSQLYSEMRDLQDYLKDEVGLNQRDMKPVKALTFRISEAIVALGRVANELQEGVMKVRMLPIAQLFNRYPRLVRDLIHDTDKQIRLEVIGEETELDKMVIEEISDPLIHLIRNAVDHGCETATERRNAGKPEECFLRLQSYHESNHVVIEISDDGRGIDLERIRQTALNKEIATPEEVERMTHRELMGLIMRPGFSTASNVTRVSGRGVGMDVVKQNVEKLNGTIEIDSRLGEGTRFRIKIPLTLAIIQALLVQVGREIFTIPLTAVEETLRVFMDEITTIEGVECIYLRNSTLSLLRLSDIFGITSESDDPEKAFVVVVNTGMRRVGLVVDALIGQEETVIKPLVDYLQEKSGFSGATILGDGRISLILDVYELVNLSFSRHAKMKELSGMGKDVDASLFLVSPLSSPDPGMMH